MYRVIYQVLEGTCGQFVEYFDTQAESIRYVKLFKEKMDNMFWFPGESFDGPKGVPEYVAGGLVYLAQFVFNEKTILRGKVVTHVFWFKSHIKIWVDSASASYGAGEPIFDLVYLEELIPHQACTYNDLLKGHFMAAFGNVTCTATQEKAPEVLGDAKWDWQVSWRREEKGS